MVFLSTVTPAIARLNSVYKSYLHLVISIRDWKELERGSQGGTEEGIKKEVKGAPRRVSVEIERGRRGSIG